MTLYREDATGFVCEYAANPSIPLWNTLTYTEQFDNAIWAKTRLTVTANQTVDISGTTSNADFLKPNAGSTAACYLWRPGTRAANTTVSVYAKAGGYNYLWLSGAYAAAKAARFDLATGTVGVQTGVTARIEAKGFGWYRCSVDFDTADAAASLVLTPDPTGGASVSASKTFDGVSGIYVFGADSRLTANIANAPIYQRVDASGVYAGAYTAISAQPTDTLANRVKWWRDLDKGATGIINSGTITAAGTAVVTAILSAGGATDGMYVGMTIAITSGGVVTTVKITAYNGTTKTATFASAMTWVAGSAYSITANWHPSEYRTPQDPAEAVLSMAFSKDAAFFSADSTGAVTDAYLGGSCTVSVYRGGSDVTNSEDWALTKVDDGCTSTLTESGGVWTLTITNVALLATKSGYVRVTATRTGSTTQVRDWNWMKVQNGSNGTNGTNGTRGSRQILVTTADGAWSDLTAWSGIVSQTGTAPVLSDLVTIAKTDGTVASSKFCTGNSASPGVWTTPTAYLNGSLLVTGTIGANQIAAGSITADRFQAGTITADLINSGTIGASTIILNGATSILKSSTYAAGSTGWQLKGDGSFEANSGTFKNVTVTGTLTAATTFSGTWTAANIPSLNASKITAGTIDASVIGVTNLSATSITTGTLNGTNVSVTNLNATNITTGTLNGARVGSGVNGTVITDATISSAKIASLDAGKITTGYLDAARINAGTITAAKLSFTPVQAGGAAGDINANATTIDGSKITTGSLNANRIAAGTITADRITAGTITADRIVTGGVDTARIAANAVTRCAGVGTVINSAVVPAGNAQSAAITVNFPTAPQSVTFIVTVYASIPSDSSAYIGIYQDGSPKSYDLVSLTGGINTYTTTLTFTGEGTGSRSYRGRIYNNGPSNITVFGINLSMIAGYR